MKIGIRRLTYKDIPFFNEVRNECCEEYLHNSCQFSLEETYDWFFNTKPLFFIIMLNGESIGYFRTSNWSKENKNIYIGADIHKDYRGKGYASEAYRQFIPIIINECNLHKISLEVLETNKRAIRLYKKFGFVDEGIKRDEVLKNGEWINSKIMSILVSDYENM